ncbi:MAG: TonB-dependent receptor [Acidobacteriota bacterium]|nr:TonB-dependent receptor [Acidobacteriota bacterium]
MKLRTLLLSLGCVLLLALPAFTQGIPTATLSGHVSSSDKQALPGVTVSLTSPDLQGTRVAVTNSNGDFNVPQLPPGVYKATFEVEGFQKVERSIKLAAAVESTLNIDMNLGGVSETIIVTGTAETISTTPQASTTYTKAFVETLPVSRDIVNTVLLTPGVTNTGPNGGLVINGSQSYESLYLVNGVVINENLRGQPFNLFIEDAIQETTTSTSGISAEYGRFAGGVVNTITKSGGNEIHGSFRTSFTNDRWSGPTPLTQQGDRLDKINERYEATLGGWLWKDHLWYFGAGRDRTTDASSQTVVTNLTFPTSEIEKRGEGKLTISPTDGQRLTASYIKITDKQNGNFFGNILDTASLNNRSLPEDLLAVNYNGVVTENFFLEGQYSRRKFSFIHAGSLFTDLTNGTLLVDGITGDRYHAPTFCGVCSPELRNNDDKQVKASYFLSTPGLGSHDLAVGYDTFNDVRKADNHQSGSDFRIFTTDTIIQGPNAIFPVFNNDQTAVIQWNPIFVLSQGTSFKTNSLYANDKWRLSDRFSFNLGVRYDKNDGKNSQGQKVAKDSKVTPRLGLTWDVTGKGDWIANASYSQYVNALANNQGDSTSRAGNPAAFQWFYNGPPINVDPHQPLLTQSQAIDAVFNWFRSQGFTNDRADLIFVNIPGGTSVIKNSLASPYTDEAAVGVSKRLGSRGLLRADYVHRTSHDFYVQRIDQTTGQTTTAVGGKADLAFIENTNSLLSRKYDGLNFQAQYRLFDKLNLGGFYTLSYTKGNVIGETAGSGPVASGVLSYPELKQTSWNAPDGYLPTDQRHRVRAWAVYELFRSGHNRLTASALENYASGSPFAAIGAVASYKFVPNLAALNYALPPKTVTYYFTKRDAFHTDALSSTDFSLNYSFVANAFTKDVEIFLQPQILNAFNRQGLVGLDTTVFDNTNRKCVAGKPCSTQPFNPFTSTPQEGVNWTKGPKFGQARSTADFQLPRTFRFSVGLRF